MKKHDLVEITLTAVNIFDKEKIIFSSDKAHVFHSLDKTQWIRVITNLVQNALQSIPKSKIPQIGIQIKTEPNKTFLSVMDNGNGIPDQIKDKIFEPKFTTKTSGMGLGLGIVKSIIESHGGEIEYVSRKNKGTTFTITLPQIEN